MLLRDGMTWAISAKISLGPAYAQSKPRRCPTCWMIHQSCRASPGGAITGRAICTRRSVLVNVPLFSAKAESRQHDVGMECRFCQEQILDDEVFKLGQCRARVVQVRIRHGRVFA